MRLGAPQPQTRVQNASDRSKSPRPLPFVPVLAKLGSVSRHPSMGHAPRSRPRRGDVRADLAPDGRGRRELGNPVLTALLYVVLGLGSLASTVAALWITVSLARAASLGGDGFTSHAVWNWFVAIVVTLGVPFGLAAWRHQRDPRRISLTMAWLPMVWNAGGIILATQFIPDILASALRNQGAWVAADRFGDSHSSTRVLSALGHHAAELTDPERRAAVVADRPPPLKLESSADVQLDRALSVPFTEEGTAILIEVELEGPRGSVDLPYLFDTGASYTTISSDTAKKLGVAVPPNAPTLTFNTASGPRESRMVYLPALQLGQVRIESLLVSVCDGCVNERTVGLLGQNVMREFFAQIDYKNQRMLLIPRVKEERPNRAYDVDPVVHYEVEGTPEVWLGRVHWVITIENRSTVPVRDVTPYVRFTDGPTLRGATVAVIEPGATGRSLVKGEASTGRKSKSKGHYQLGLAEAYW